MQLKSLLLILGACATAASALVVNLVIPDEHTSVDVDVIYRPGGNFFKRQETCQSQDSCEELCTAPADDSARNAIAQCAVNPTPDLQTCICNGWTSLSADTACAGCLLSRAECLTAGDGAQIVQECKLPAGLLSASSGTASSTPASLSAPLATPSSASVAVSTSTNSTASTAPLTTTAASASAVTTSTIASSTAVSSSVSGSAPAATSSKASGAKRDTFSAMGGGMLVVLGVVVSLL